MALGHVFQASLLFVFIVASIINNMALTSPQNRKAPPNLTFIPKTSFSCKGRPAGYYADPEAHCQAYHMCDTLEQQYSYLCPGFTLFNQKYMVCDHWHRVNCSIADQFYHLNKMIGKVPGKESEAENNVITDGTKEDQPPKKLSMVFKINTFRTFQPPSAITPTTLPTTTTKLQQPKTFKSTPQVISQLFTLPEITTRNVTQTTRRPATTRPRKKPPLFKPRELGEKIRFVWGRNDSVHAHDIVQFKVVPLSNKPFFNTGSFTVSPEVLGTTTTPSITGRDDDDEKDSESENLDTIDPLAFLVPPLRESQTLAPPSIFLVPPVRNSPTVFLVPPSQGPVVLKGNIQEDPPLIVSNRFFSSRRLRFPPPQSRITPPRFPFPHSNPQFFIPSPGLIPPLEDNSLSDEDDANDDPDDGNVVHKMTMTFPNSTMMMFRRRQRLKINPDCPRCHPAFLKPNQCRPCVIIKR